jgi:RimJ/RimL family protein N-acetyltransferase
MTLTGAHHWPALRVVVRPESGQAAAYPDHGRSVVVNQMSEVWATVAVVDDVTQAIRLEDWTQADLSLLRQANTPEMTAHLGGPETEDKLLDRHRRYLQRGDPGAGQMFAIVLAGGQRAGIIGYWERTWHDELVYETGWNIAPTFQGRGIATAAARAIRAHPRPAPA